MAEINSKPLLPGADVRVYLPNSILYDLEAFQRVQASVLAQAGCLGCTSGINFQWLAFEEYVVNAAGEVRPVVPGVEAPVAGEKQE
jgi:hypothetical protein